MEQGMQNYLKRIAIKTKIENYKEFDKSKEETAISLVKNFNISHEEAQSYLAQFWDSNPYVVSGISLAERRQLLLEEKSKKMQEYDLAIEIVEDAINGYSPEIIANQKGVSIKKTLEILGERICSD